MSPDALPSYEPKDLQTDAPLLASHLRRLVRHERYEVDTLFESLDVKIEVDGTKARAYCHVLKNGPNGLPCVGNLIMKIFDDRLDYAIPRSKIEDAINIRARSGSSSYLCRLEREARNLFANVETSGEGGELLLSMMTESVLGLPQIISKMSLKTNPQVHYHGCDGVHAMVVEDTGRLELYWGESKLHKDTATSVRECFSSLAPFLLDEGSSRATQERDLQLLRSDMDLNDAALERALISYLDPRSANYLRYDYCGVCLVGFDSDKYPLVNHEKEIGIIIKEMTELVPYWHERIRARIKDENLENFKIEVFCLPFPSVDDFRTSFRRELEGGNGVS
ncbi:DUF1837 domain-containing protein [bacterium]|nr:DUF1837 domain-containing protein [bacterium]